MIAALGGIKTCKPAGYDPQQQMLGSALLKGNASVFDPAGTGPGFKPGDFVLRFQQ
ncbi:MAG: hypothetical protein ACYCZO_01690 [Daejeonella sp.]